MRHHAFSRKSITRRLSPWVELKAAKASKKKDGGVHDAAIT
jgi:hypothetical protein